MPGLIQEFQSYFITAGNSLCLGLKTDVLFNWNNYIRNPMLEEKGRNIFFNRPSCFLSIRFKSIRGDAVVPSI